jgi:predicted RNA-binding protein YlqC (UPF0109 family)
MDAFRAADDQGKMSSHEYVRGLLLRMVQIIVDHPRAVEVEADYSDECTTFIVTVNSSDIHRLIGAGDRNANSLRIIVSAIGRKFREQMRIEVDERRC